MLNKLTAISPVDGRYRNTTETLADYFSEQALIRYRIRVEVEYFIALCEIPLPQLAGIDRTKFAALRALYLDFSPADAERVKQIESVTNHDVKAIEYIIKEKMDTLGLEAYKEFVHFGLTSQDINNTAIPLSLKEAMAGFYYPAVEEVRDKLAAFADEWHDVPMLARTHGQPASPTTLGKEFMVFVERIEKQLAMLHDIAVPAKFGGATGNFNAHRAAYPQYDWVAFANRFVGETLGLCRSQYTTQIEHYDNLAAIFDNMKRIDTILIDLCRDMWTYISMEYFKQQIKAGEVGSSAMPHKVNPIDFENAEGNFGIANALFEHLSSKLPRLAPPARPHRLDRAAQHRRSGGPRRHCAAIADEGTQQGDPQPRSARPRSGKQLGRGGRRHPDHSAPRGLPQALRGAQGPDPHQRPHHPRVDRRIHRDARRGRNGQGGAARTRPLDLHGRIPLRRKDTPYGRQVPDVGTGTCFWHGLCDSDNQLRNSNRSEVSSFI